MNPPRRLQRFRQRGGVFVAVPFALMALVALSGRQQNEVGVLQKTAGLALLGLGGAVVTGSGRTLGRNLIRTPIEKC
ncbi:hypothetical protein DESA109040_14320 [Deinococcus saxicola]|uniref:hypothetical protein n=1 Tax=Deinococcus saxicola TaxID=249406 RepID=UPI0039F072BC